MAWSSLAANQMVSEAEAATAGFTLLSGQTNSGTLKCMTKANALSMYLLNSVSMNSYSDNQLVPKSVWQVVADTSAPTVPTNVIYTYYDTISGDDDMITWTASTDNIGVVSYDIYVSKNGSPFINHNRTTTYLNVYYNDYARTYGSGTWGFKVRAKDAAGNVSAFSTEVFYVMDSQKTGAHPTSLSATAITSTTFNLNWVASTRTVSGYSIYKDGVLYANTGNVLSFPISGLNSSTAYSFRISATESGTGFESQLSNYFSVTTAAPAGDTTPPTAPNFVSASNNSADTIEIFWNGDTDNIGVTDYYVYRNNIYMGSSTVRSYYDYGVPNGTWFYQIYALDAAGNISPISAESNYVNIGGGTGIQPN
ncbi:fibronectin type III domain-containing protein [Flavobacterium sp. LB3P21]|uniref:fibronectin type III domain-containing protein n=1 Tax=Flavobacterium sp. LB3P21 TaxID=3401719 RepID=UPI003AAC2F98